MNKANKTWVCTTAALLITIILALGLAVIVIDPYSHYHMPLSGWSYRGFNALYNNNGILRNDDYDALIIGTSMTSGFSADEASEIFGEHFIRTTFLGEGNFILDQNLRTALRHQKSLRHVIRSLDPTFFVTAADWTGTGEYPEYLYNENPFDDVYYLYNLGVWHDAMIPTIQATANHLPPEEDDDSDEARAAVYLQEAKALEKYERPEKSDAPIDPAETEEFFRMMKENLTANVIESAQQYPDVRFDIYLPPYSVLWWDSVNQAGPGRIDRRVDMERYAIELLLPYPNIHIYSFTNQFDVVCDLENYSDEAHYKPNVNTMILHWIHDGVGELTQDNYEDYLSEIRSFYTQYDYEALYSGSAE